MGHGESPFARRAIDFQRTIKSVHLYPYVTVIEKRSTPLVELTAPQRGTEWQPFLGAHEPNPRTDGAR